MRAQHKLYSVCDRLLVVSRSPPAARVAGWLVACLCVSRCILSLREALICHASHACWSLLQKASWSCLAAGSDAVWFLAQAAACALCPRHGVLGWQQQYQSGCAVRQAACFVGACAGQQTHLCMQQLTLLPRWPWRLASCRFSPLGLCPVVRAQCPPRAAHTQANKQDAALQLCHCC